MDSDYDPQHEAEALMKLALTADWLERQRLIRLAVAWQELALHASVDAARRDGKPRQALALRAAVAD